MVRDASDDVSENGDSSRDGDDENGQGAMLEQARRAARRHCGWVPSTSNGIEASPLRLMQIFSVRSMRRDAISWGPVQCARLWCAGGGRDRQNHPLLLVRYFFSCRLLCNDTAGRHDLFEVICCGMAAYSLDAFGGDLCSVSLIFCGQVVAETIEPWIERGLFAYQVRNHRCRLAKGPRNLEGRSNVVLCIKV